MLRAWMLLGSMALLASGPACKKVAIEMVPEVTKVALDRATSSSPTPEQHALATYRDGLSLLESSAQPPAAPVIAAARASFEKAAKGAPQALAHLAPLAAKAGDGPEARERLRAALEVADLKSYDRDRGYRYWYRLTNEHVRLVTRAGDPAAYDQALAAFQQVHRDLQAFTRSKGDGLNPTFRMYAGHVDAFARTAAIRDRPRSQLLDAHHFVLAATSSLTLLEKNDRLE